MTTGKTIALTRQTFVGKVMSLLFNMLSRLVITFLPRSKRLLISWLQSPSAVILEPPKIKSATVSTVSPSICHEVMFAFYFFASCGLKILSADFMWAFTSKPLHYRVWKPSHRQLRVSTLVFSSLYFVSLEDFLTFL